MNDIVQFLHDRLNDDEAFMQAAIRLRESGAITASPAATEGAFALMDVVANDPDTVRALSVFTLSGTRAPGEAERVLVEVEAKRQIIDWHRPPTQDEFDEGTYRTMGCRCYDGWPCTTLRALALPFADHADYQENWRP